ncbi:MAG: rod shape-determining protein RodA, partial [Peptococcaceae bacterium]|nr:rod shape-determining protein RodA [Peptococcaceae bacterium]
KMDISMLITVAAIIALGLVVLDSAASIKTNNYVERQLLFVALGASTILIFLKFDYSVLKNYASKLYFVALALLIAVLLFGSVRGGAKGWFALPGGMTLQPAEFCKILLILSYAQFLSVRRESLNTIQELIPCFLFMVPPVLLLLIQPDLGSALVYIFIMIGMLFMAGANRKILFGLFGGGTIALILYLIGVWKFDIWCPLEKYQLNRFLVLFDPSLDPQGAGYNVIQSKIAIGNGGLTGEGLYMGSQSTGAFLPEQWTDFIFAVLAEELGFIGAGTLLILYAFLLYRGLHAAMMSKDLYGTLVAAGIVSMYLFHILENAGMTMGLMPVTGIPLPFVSYGGSSTLTNLVGIAILQNIYIHRERLMF